MLEKKGNRIAILIFFVFLFLMSLWCIDISLSALMLENGNVTNGFYIRDPMLAYHIGLYTAILSLFGFAMFFVHIILGDE